MLKEFKEFIMRGNVLDLAIGVLLGSAFGKIVTSSQGGDRFRDRYLRDLPSH